MQLPSVRVAGVQEGSTLPPPVPDERTRVVWQKPVLAEKKRRALLGDTRRSCETIVVRAVLTVLSLGGAAVITLTKKKKQDEERRSLLYHYLGQQD